MRKTCDKCDNVTLLNIITKAVEKFEDPRGARAHCPFIGMVN